MDGEDSQYGNGNEFSSSYQNRGPPAKRPRGDDRDRQLADFLDRKDLKLVPNHILLITIRDTRYPINVEVINKVCSIVGTVNRIVVFERNAVVQAMVEFDTLETASRARKTLHGCDIYNNCCTMRVDYSKMDALKCKGNGPMSWDFTRERGGEGMGDEDKRTVILNEPGIGGGRGGAGPDFMSGMRSMDMMGGNMGMGNQGMMGMGGQGNMGGQSNLGGQGNMGMGGQGNMGMGGQGRMGGQGNMGMGGQGNMGMGGQGNMGMGGQGNMGMGGQGNMGMRGQQGRGGYEMMGERSSGFGGIGGSCVVIVHNLAVGEVNCDRLFNLVCLYGNVSKIFFMKNKSGCAMVEMSDPESAMRLVSNVQGVEVFNDRLKVEISKKHATITNAPLEWELSDGTSSVKDYSQSSRMNRFNTPDMARKNRILPPTKVLHFYGILKVSDDEVMDLFSQYCAPQPNKIKWVEAKRESQARETPDYKAGVPGVGLAYFDSVTDATEALILVNHREVDDRTIKLCFSPATF